MKKTIATIFLSWGLATLPAVVLSAAPNAYSRDHSREYDDIRGVVDRTQSDLRAASGLEHGNKQTGRYQHAQDTLSKFDRKLLKGKFDKSTLDQSIEHLKAVVNHNTLQPSTRDALMHDLDDLRAARERR